MVNSKLCPLINSSIGDKINHYVVLFKLNIEPNEIQQHFDDLLTQITKSNEKNEVNFKYDTLPGYSGIFSDNIIEFIRLQKQIDHVEQYAISQNYNN